MDKLVLIGGGGHCRSCIEVIESTGKYDIYGIIDLPFMSDKSILGYPLIGSDDQIPSLAAQGFKFLITIGQLTTPEVRKKIFLQLTPFINQVETIVASSAVVSRHSVIGRGNIIMHNAVINAGATIGNNNIINTGALVEHDSAVGNHCHISTHAVINGDCKIGNDVFIGSNSVIINRTDICDNVVIAAGSTIRQSIDIAGIYTGLPFRRLK